MRGAWSSVVAWYSVPSTWKHLDATAHVAPGNVTITCRGQSTTKPRQHFGQRAIAYRDDLPELARKPQAVRQVAPELLAELGEPFGRLWELVVQAHGPQEAARVLARFVGAVHEHGEEPVREAVVAAMQAGRTDPLSLAALMVPRRIECVPVPEAQAHHEIEVARAADYDLVLGGWHVAQAIRRTDDAVVLKVMNLRTILSGGERGMSQGSRTDARVVRDFAQHLDDLVAAVNIVEAEASSTRGTLAALTVVPSDSEGYELPADAPRGAPLVTERLAWQARRVGQGLFRSRVLRNFAHACGFCGLRSRRPETNSFLLVASHVLPWRAATSHQRLDPRNGVSLCAIHDRAFDWGFMTLDESLRIQVSSAAEHHYAPRGRVEVELLAFRGEPLGQHVLPPADAYLAHHRASVFDKRFRQAARR